MKTNPALSALRHHVTGAIARGEAQAITEVPATTRLECSNNKYLDARLIAAAPELLEALEAVLPDLEHYVATHGPGPDKRLAIARAAIAKAKGGDE